VIIFVGVNYEGVWGTASIIVGNSYGETITEILANIKYRYSLKKLLNHEVNKIIDVEIQKATIIIAKSTGRQ
jgi:hypothetical protein